MIKNVLSTSKTKDKGWVSKTEKHVLCGSWNSRPLILFHQHRWHRISVGVEKLFSVLYNVVWITEILSYFVSKSKRLRLRFQNFDRKVEFWWNASPGCRVVLILPKFEMPVPGWPFSPSHNHRSSKYDPKMDEHLNCLLFDIFLAIQSFVTDDLWQTSVTKTGNHDLLGVLNVRRSFISFPKPLPKS